MSLATKDTSQPRREVQSFANTLAQALQHWGHTPAYIFRLAENGQLILVDETGTIELTENGTLDVVGPLADDETQAVEFDGDRLEFGVNDIIPVGVDDNWTRGALMRRPSGMSSNELIADNSSFSGNGFAIRLQSDGTLQVRIEDNGGDAAQRTPSDDIDDGQPHLYGMVVDWPGDQMRCMIDTKGSTGVRSLASNNVDQTLAGDGKEGVGSGFLGTGDDPYHGDVGCYFAVGEWMSSPQWTALYNWQQDRDNQPTIPTQLPNYITNAFGSSGPDFWWSADRHFRHKDGEGVVQLTDFAGSNFISQRSSSNQPIARGSSSRGKPTDYLEYNGSEYHRIDKDFGPSDGWSIAFSGRLASGTGGTRVPIRLEAKENSTLLVTIQWESDSNEFDYFMDDANGNRGAGTEGAVDLFSDHAFVLTGNFTNDRIRFIAEDVNGNTIDVTQSPGYSSSAETTLDFGAIGRKEKGRVREIVGRHYESIITPQSLSDSEQDTLLSGLVSKL